MATSLSIRDEYTFEWDGSVPASPQTFATAEEAQAYIDRAAKAEGPEWASRYGRIVRRSVVIAHGEWGEVQ